jgi:hypothetical protein
MVLLLTVAELAHEKKKERCASEASAKKCAARR